MLILAIAFVLPRDFLHFELSIAFRSSHSRQSVLPMFQLNLILFYSILLLLIGVNLIEKNGFLLSTWNIYKCVSWGVFMKKEDEGKKPTTPHLQ